MFRFVVMPCLDEGPNLIATCESLGMLSPDADGSTRFVLVDNGSGDDTPAVIRAIAGRAAPGAVVVAEEAERGHAPVRRRGVDVVLEVAARLSAPPVDVLVLQVDADTIYGAGYVDAMAAKAGAVGPGSMVQGLSVPPRPADDLCAGFRALERLVDDFVTGLAAADPRDDVVVDDKVAAYRLSDYLSWGGHVRDLATDGSELLAETTRLMLRARARGARRVAVPDAVAWTSQRRVLEDPALAFATAGYPRLGPWRRDWRATYAGTARLEDFEPGGVSRPELRQAVIARVCHVLGLFGVLPAHVGAASAGRSAGVLSGVLRELGLSAPESFVHHPALVLEKALRVEPAQVERLIAGIGSRPPWDGEPTA